MNVDMIDAARNAQWNPLTFLGPGSLRAIAPAKVNLFLAVGDVLPDGRHAVTTVMHALALHDTLHVQVRPLDDAPQPDGLPIDIDASREEGEEGEGGARPTPPTGSPDAGAADRATCDEARAEGDRRAPDDGLPPHVAVGGPRGNLRVTLDVADKGAGAALDIPARDNIVFRAADLLARAVAWEVPTAIDVRLEKAIPHQAGLGGGSSDAAAMLLALARAWGLPDDDPKLEIVASVLGADVAFFLHGGCALLDGQGERFVHALAPMKRAVVLVKPPVGVSTARAYAAFDAAPVVVDPAVLQEACAAQDAADVPLVNNLAPAAESLWSDGPDAADAADGGASPRPAASPLVEVRTWLAAQPGVDDVLLCGSGAATFAVTDDFAVACRVAAAAQARGWWARATTFSGIRAAVMPS
ncbi:MAG: hypothetical protein HFJ75_00650 [Eggerthellaceae bacterium]|nr:hypothetical protein [Eggerthellaceae bacterium]